ncbi:MAG: transporter substrate-binding domain-containing protein [Bacillota bacterium]|nr:transporter substrate-binding domain-containing protein [Bacillota bacterium]
MKKILAVLFAVVMVFSFAACGDKKQDEQQVSKQKFVMGIDAEYPPFSYLGSDGKYTGFDVEICQAACEKLGWEWDVFGVNWDQKLIQLDAKECDCVWAGMTILDSMKEAGYVLSNPYFDSRQVFLVKADSGIKTVADIAGKDVAVMLGTSGETLLNEDLTDIKATFNKLITTESFVKAFAELDGNGVDAVFVDFPVAKAQMAKNAGAYVLIDEDLGVEQYGIAFRSTDAELCKQIESAVAELVKDGTYEQIASKPEYAEIKDNLIFLQK